MITADIVFDSYVMDNDKVQLSGETREEVEQEFMAWCVSRGMPADTPATYYVVYDTEGDKK